MDAVVCPLERRQSHLHLYHFAEANFAAAQVEGHWCIVHAA